mmetsp:Transcript_28261/g.91502  ORF Transcript_28261/g.91502 Transcript_28261/m.91502 type:complete len:969 (-) Transcript_28261:184-3090(-)
MGHQTGMYARRSRQPLRGKSTGIVVLDVRLLMLLSCLVSSSSIPTSARKLLAEIRWSTCKRGTPVDFRYLIGKTFEASLGPEVAHGDATLAGFQSRSEFSYCSTLRHAGFECQDSDANLAHSVNHNECSRIFAFLERTLDLTKIERWQRIASQIPTVGSTDVLTEHRADLLKLELSRHLASFLSVRSKIDTETIIQVVESYVEDADLKSFSETDENSEMCSASLDCSPEFWRVCANSTGSEEMLVDISYSDALRLEVQSAKSKIWSHLERFLMACAKDAYLFVLAREPSSSESDAFVADMKDGKGYRNLAQELRATDEYRTKCSTAPCTSKARNVVESMFLDVLLRPVDPSGVQSYGNELHDGLHVRKLRSILQESEEYKNLCLKGGEELCGPARKSVQMLYRQVLGREPDAQGLAGYARHIVNKELTEAELRREFESSEEYLYGVGLRKRALTILESLKRSYEECSHVKDANDSYWQGRWCDRSGCEDNGVFECSSYPYKLYLQTEFALSTSNPQLSDDSVSLYETHLRNVTREYISKLGRFPDRRTVGRVASKETSWEALTTGLLESEERRTNIASRMEPASVQAWRSKIEILANLMQAHALKIPQELVDCFSEDARTFRSDVGGPDSCMQVGRVLARLQSEWNEKAPLLGLSSQSSDRRMVPIAIYVHERPKYFRAVIEGLKAVKRIEDSVVIVVSMDSVHAEMIEIALSVDFAPLRIIFHPVNEDLIKNHPILAVKLHWIWLQDMLWNSVPETKAWDGDIALLEEDHVVTPDYLLLLDHLLVLKREACPRCWGVTVRWACMPGDAGVTEQDAWKLCRSHTFINTGIAFNRTTYLHIKRSDFDFFPDGWDWSLFHLAQTGQMPDMILGPAVSRLSNVGHEGVTVEQGDDDVLLKQLDYAVVSHTSSSAFQASKLWLDTETRNQFLPPSWEPLYLGSVGFLWPQPFQYVLDSTLPQRRKAAITSDS